MAFSHYITAVSSLHTKHLNPIPIITKPSSNFRFHSFKSSFTLKSSKFPLFPIISTTHLAKAIPQESESGVAVDTFTHFKHVLLPVTDRNPYLSEGTRQAAATTTALAKKYGADITIVVIDEKEKLELADHDKQLSNIRWHLSEGGFQDYKLLERLGEGKKPTAIIGEVADDLNLDLVVMSMEAIHSKQTIEFLFDVSELYVPHKAITFNFIPFFTTY